MPLISSQKNVVQEIISTHSPNDNFDVDKTALLTMAQDILCNEFATLARDPITGINVPIIGSNVLDNEPGKGITERLAFILHKIGCELSCNCSGGGGIMSITLTLFEKLGNYSWEDKLVLVLSAFAVSYGEFRLVLKPPDTNPLAKYVHQLKRLPAISELETVIIGLLTVVIRITKTIIELNGLPSQYISRDKTSYTDYELSYAVYWAVRGIVTCCSQSISFMSQRNMVSIIETREKMISLTERLATSHEKLKNILEDKKFKEAYYRIQYLLRTIQTDNMKILSEFIQKYNGKALFNGATDEEASLDVLKSKTVILFFSRWDISEEQVKEVGQQVCKPDRQYEIVWLPIRDKTVTTTETVEIENTIRSKARLMKCHSLHYSVILQSYVIQYIKKEWLLEKKEAMVVFDAYGKVVNSDAYQMMMVWGSAAYPFHAQREEILWRKWSIEWLLIEGVVSEKQQWVQEKTVIYLYGGDDLDWIRKFIKNTKEVVKTEEIILEFIYVGKKHTETIKNEKLASEVWEEPKIWQFLARVNLIHQSKTQLGMSITNDKTLIQLRALLDAGGDGHGWTIVGQGSNDMAVIMNEYLATQSLVYLVENKVEISKENFISKLHGAIKAVKRSLKYQESDVHKFCNHIFVPTGNMVCADCQLPMEKESIHKIQVVNKVRTKL
ncbi:protein SIEVE ELEMENT OCCLUSION B-like protein [Cinnamomum micranthum f. kanehirae]|uniref:Protein SIEVE ELEMENT OCCLUSION B-like protein n=1 Tax=Cinnamomum micranthum f. kanehirae TaxID=337451 RepID=A0A3S3NSK4_9MAGN|nr:protein SIEVE ELEMENT OCCLUSION B-like protein [Cinnamomum micranthum f. kanehirae]